MIDQLKIPMRPQMHICAFEIIKAKYDYLCD